MTIAALVEAEKHSRFTGLLGNLHPGIVHFPIALLATVALLETLQMIRKKEGAAPGSLAMTVIAALSSIPACLFGFMLQDYSDTEGSTVELHKWLGLASAAVSIVAAATAWKGALKAFRISVFLGTALVMATGYLGGEMIMGPDHLLKFLHAEEAKTKPAPPKQGDGTKPLLTATDKIDFETQIAPIIKNACFKCHNPGKKKGKLLLDTKANAMKGGEGGPCIVPGDLAKSTFYTLLIDSDPDTRMPEKPEKPLPKEQIELVKKWIEQGAAWPDGVVIK